MKIVRFFVVCLIVLIFAIPILCFNVDNYCKVSGVNEFCYNYKKISNGCLPNVFDVFNIPSQARYELINGEKCTKLKRFRPYILEAVNKYKTPKLQLTTGIIGAMLNQESNVGLSLTNGSCTGYGDNGHGHGLAQIDNRFFKELPKTYSPLGIRVGVLTKNHGQEKFVWSDCQDAISWLTAYLVQTSELTENLILTKAKDAGLDTTTNSDGSFSSASMQKAFLQLTLNSYNSGPGLFSSINQASCEVKKSGEVTDDCTTDKSYGLGVLKTALEVNKCLEIKTTTQEKYNSVTKNNNNDGKKRECIRPSKEPIVAKAQANYKASFPLQVTDPNISLRYTQPYPRYLSGGYHAGIDIAPNPQTTKGVKVISVDNGTIVSDRLVLSTLCVTTNNCQKKNQRQIRILSDQGNVKYIYSHLADTKPYVMGTKVKRGDPIADLDNFAFIHLDFAVQLHDQYQQPVDYIQNWNRKICPSDKFAPCSFIPKDMYR